jgi:hypothetical protein
MVFCRLSNGFFGESALQEQENKAFKNVVLSSFVLFEGIVCRARDVIEESMYALLSC